CPASWNSSTPATKASASTSLKPSSRNDSTNRTRVTISHSQADQAEPAVSGSSSRAEGRRYSPSFQPWKGRSKSSSRVRTPEGVVSCSEAEEEDGEGSGSVAGSEGLSVIVALVRGGGGRVRLHGSRRPRRRQFGVRRRRRIRDSFCLTGRKSGP